jgi:hypothetical protein
MFRCEGWDTLLMYRFDGLTVDITSVHSDVVTA